MPYYSMYRTKPAGTPGWPLAPVPGWGVNPERAGPAWLALDGFGDVAPITTCPHCSVLKEGSCVSCADGEAHPSCKDCKGGTYQPPWYKTELFRGFLLAVGVSVASGYALHRMRVR